MRAGSKVLIAIGLTAVMILMLAGQSLAGPPDIQNHWAEKQISDWVDRGHISGYPDGSFKPENSITRAEFITMVNNAFGKTATVQIGYPDVSGGEWFAAGVARAVAAGYISGYDDGTFRPNENIKRQEAAVIITKLLNLNISSDTDALNQFADYADIPQWSKGYIEAVVAGSYMSGYPDQTYRPEGYITRAEAVSTLDRALNASVTTVTFDKTGTYGPVNGIKTIDGSVNISAAGVTLQNTIITGNLFLAESVGDGDVTLKNVIVQGNTVIKGGGRRSVLLENCSLPNITVGKEGVRIVASGNTSVSIVRLETGAMLVEVSLSGPGFETVTVTEQVPAGAEITLDGNFDNINVNADEVRIEITGGTVTNMEIAGTAAGAVIDIAADAKVSTMTLNAAVSVTGQGTVGTAYVNVSGTTFEREPAKIEKADDITVTTGGGGAAPTAAITISNIDATNTLGKFKFDTDTVTTLAELEGKIMADGIDVIDIAKRNSGEVGKVWNAFLATTPYEYDTEYVITCESPFTISGNDTVMWSSSTAAPAAINVTAEDVDNNGDGSDLEVSFDSQKGQNTKIETYRVLVVKSADASSFTLSDANAATHYTIVDRIEDAPSYTVVLDAGAKDVDGDDITEDVFYKVFVLSVADGVNASENALSAASASITLSSGGGGGGGGSGDLSDAGAALETAGSKTAGVAFNLSITGAKDAAGTNLSGSIAVTVTSDLDGQVFSGSVTFTSGAATVAIPAGEVTTAGTNTLTVAITGVTPQPEVEVSVTALTEIDASNSTAEISPALAEGTTSTITVTLRDQYNNPMANTTKNLKIVVTITNNDSTTAESYTVDGDVLTATPALPLARANEPADANGKVYFDVTLPATVDIGDGISVQVTKNNGIDNIGSAFTFTGGGGDLSDAGAALAVAGSKAAGATFDLSVTGAKDTAGNNLTGSIAVTVTSDLDGQVFSGSATFTGGAATVTIAAGEVTTAGTNTLTVAIDGVTPEPEVEVSVTALTEIDASNSTAEISPALAEGTTSTITVTLRDQYNNPMANTTKNLKIVVTITNNDSTTAESYTVDGDVLTATPALPLARADEPTDADGKVYFDVTVPAAVDAGDGIAVQVTQNNGTDIGSAFSYTGGAGGGDLSDASAALAVAGSKTAGATFDLSVTGAKDTAGTNLAGSIAVTVTSDLDGQVFSGSATFTDGSATVTIAAGEVTTAGTNTLTVAITGVTPQPQVEVTVTATTQISASNSTAEISPALAGGATSTITVTLRDQYNNPMADTTKSLKIEVTITAADGTTTESYTVDGEVLTATPALPLARADEPTDAYGKVYFDVTVPAAVDAGDGITVQVTQNNGTDIGSAFSYTGETAAAAPEFSSAEVTTQGDVSITFDKDITDPTGIGAESQFTVTVDGDGAGFSSVIKTNTPTKIKIVMYTKITSSQVVTVAYTKGDVEASQITSTDGGVLETFGAQDATNGSSLS